MPNGGVYIKVSRDVHQGIRRIIARRELDTGKRLTISEALAMLLRNSGASLTLREPPYEASTREES